MAIRNTNRSTDSPQAFQSLCATAGTELARVRIARGITVADVSERLLLSPRQVEALEDGQAHVFPSSSYYLSALRRYAAFAEIDSGLVAKVGEAMRSGPVRTPTDVVRSVALVAALFLVAAVGACVWWFARTPTAPSTADATGGAAPIPTIVFSQDPSTPSVAFAPPATAEPSVASTSAPAAPASPAPSDEARLAAAETETTVATNAAAKAAAGVARPPSARPAAAQRPPLVAGAFGALRVHDATWVLVRDAHDSVVGRTLPADGAFQLESAPAYLAVGTPNVDLFVGSRRVDVAGYVVNGQIEMRTRDFAALAENDPIGAPPEQR